MTVPQYSHSSDQDSDIADSLHPTITEESPDFIMSFDGGEEAGVYAPPPHVAARIYKSRYHPRKGSAASSRRNSIASHQSSRSGRSAHGGPQSTHVAQHLRRASIIEDRRAKAADRNAHAEKVRLRAALNKATPRGPMDREGKAAAAQQAREKYLAQVRANCAAEVQRSKRIAEEQREKKAAEYLKMKADMAERHAQAERRRALIEQSQRRPRTAQSPSGDAETARRQGYIWKPRNQVEAATIIQVAWRRKYRRIVIQAFLQLGLTVKAAEDSTFEEISERLNRDDVIQKALSVLRLFHLTDDCKSLSQEQIATRRFLSSFIILGQPDTVTTRNSDRQKDVLAKSQDLLLRMNQAFDASGDMEEAKMIQQRLSESYAAFMGAFADWRTDESSFMVSMMVAQFVELDATWQSVKDAPAEEVTEHYREGIRYNQTLIITKLKKMAGPEKALKLIREGIRKRRKEMAQRASTGLTIPRTATEVQHDSSKALAPPASSAHVDPTKVTSNSLTAAKEQLQSSSLVPNNRTIVHELAINKHWTIDCEQREAKRDEIIEETAAQLQKGLDAGLGDVWIPALAESLLQRLSNILPPDKPTFQLIKEVLDPEMVAQQVKNGVFSYENFFNFMNSILPKLCAPVRDEEVKELASKPSSDPVRQIARINFVVELMVLDMLNFQLIHLAPTLLKESVEYEANAFEKGLNGRFPERSYAWWKRSLVAARDEANKRSAEPVSNSSPDRMVASKVYMHGLVDLAVAIDPLTESALPETLLLDSERLSRIRSDLLRLITISAILLNAKNLLRRDTRSLWKTEAARMWDLPLSSPPSSFISIIESRYALPPTTKQQLTSFITRILSEARENQANHPVLKVLLKKVKAHVLARLSASSEEERNRLSTTSTEVLGSAGMVEFVGRIGDWVQELSRIADVDREAHSKWYDEIIARVEKEEDTKES